MNKVLSIKQPWIDLILTGEKTIEVRTWKTSYRGRLYLHSPQQPDKIAMEYFKVEKPLIYGCVLGFVDLVDCIDFTRESWHSARHQHLNYYPFEEGLKGWLLKNPVVIKPVPLKGKLGVFNWKGEINNG